MISSQELENLTKEQRELLLLLLKDKGVDVSCLPIIAQPRDRTTYPLAFAQRRLWILNQLEPESAVYNMCGALQLLGSLNSQRLEQCFNELIKRHDILRATFAVKDNQPALMIANELTLTLGIIDLSNRQVDASSSTIQDVIREEGQIPFDLTSGPLLRASLIKLADKEHILLFTIHHIISDAWSLRIILQELDYYYRALTGNGVHSKPDLTIQYPDYTVWQEDLVQSPAFSNSIEYWQKQLNSAEHILNLPTDHMRPAIQTYAGSRVTFTLPVATSKHIKALSLQQDVSLFMFLLTAFQILLFRYTDQEDIAIGTVSSNRSRTELEHLIGFFSNTLVLRADLSRDPRFDELLKSTRKNVLDAFAHQDIPFEKLVEELKVSRDLSRHPLFQVMFVYDEKALDINIGDINTHQLNIENPTSKFDLTLFVEASEKGLTACFEYNTDLFDQESITRYADSFVALLDDITANPHKHLSELNVVNAQEAERLLTWSDRSGPAKDHCLHQLFETHAKLSPNEIAVTYQNKQINYRDLNARSNQIANGLIKLNLKINQPVAIMLETGFDQIAALLGVCKAGGVFVCLDKSYPVMRLQQILEEVKPICVMTDTANLDVHGQSLLSLDFFADAPSHNPDVTVLPTDPVYIVYTSGSTGKPKGILQAHGCSSQYMEWQRNQFNIHAGKRMAQWASITYDASYSEIFGALCFGATLCIVNTEDRRDPQALSDWLVSEKINVIQLVPSFCALLLQCLKKSYPTNDRALAHLEFVLLAGERLPIELARDFQHYFKQSTRLYNLYGPSEIVLTTQYLIDELPPNLKSIPIGHPFTGRQILILDKHHKLCPIRVPGEIYIRSPYLTLGYYKQPEETAKVFMQNPLHNDFSDRVYKTGDRGRWLNEHDIEFLGRNDNQLKIRGSRVELGEVEATLSLHKAIIECAIIAKQHPDGSPYLVAFLSSAEKLSVSSLREFLSAYLPSYMIPTHFVLFETLPHTISGKVDRKALSALTDFQQEIADKNAVPANDLEKHIAAIWKEVLNIETVRNDSNFFDMGGHSLLMVQVQLKLNEKLHSNIPLMDMFRFPTIKSLASALSKQENETDFSTLGTERALQRKRLLKKRK